MYLNNLWLRNKIAKKHISLLAQKFNRDQYYMEITNEKLHEALMHQELADREQHYANTAKSNLESRKLDQCLGSLDAMDTAPTTCSNRFGSEPNLLEKALYDCFIGAQKDERKLCVLRHIDLVQVQPKERTLRQRAEANKRASEANRQFLEPYGFKKQ